MGRPRHPRGRGAAQPAVRRPPPGSRSDVPAGVRRLADGGAPGAPPRPDHRHHGPQHPHLGAQPTDYRPHRRPAAGASGAQLQGFRRHALRPLQPVSGHRACHRAGAGADPAGAGHRLRRQPHLHARRVRRVRNRHRHVRSRACPRHPNPAPVQAQDDGDKGGRASPRRRVRQGRHPANHRRDRRGGRDRTRHRVHRRRHPPAVDGRGA